MPPAHPLYVWKKAPALRLLLPVAAGIALQWYASFSLQVLVAGAVVLLVLLLAFAFLPPRLRFAWQPFWGLLLTLLAAVAGALAVWANNVSNRPDWFGKQYNGQQWVLATLQEPVVEKNASCKALAKIKAIGSRHGGSQASGKAILYFKKDSLFSRLSYGQQVLIAKPLQPIKNSGNPGGFNYQRYSFFQGITHQAYVTQQDVVLLTPRRQKDFKTFLFWLRAGVIHMVSTYIPGEAERGLAEALLIGYKDDLDKTLLQAYADTGVVHVIAISGLHLGLIYAILLLLTKPLHGKKLAWLRAVLIIAALWLFTLLAGFQASVVRSAVMFTILALGVVLNKKASVYNMLSLSALLLLLYQPFWLWDVGFQLSYAAVLSIALFYRPIYNRLYFQNKAVDAVWQLTAVTLAAQILTTPFSLYHFHQFPMLFLLTNLVAVPLSSIILIGEIVLCAAAFVPSVAQWLGALLHHLIAFLNGHILQFSSIRFASWQNLYISFWQAALLLFFVAAMGYWLQHKARPALLFSAAALLFFVLLRTASFVAAQKQKKLIVYNIPKRQAIDVMDGRTLHFIGDAEAEQDNSTYMFHLLPARVRHRAGPGAKTLPKAFVFYGRKVVVLDTTLPFQKTTKPVVDLLILSKNPQVYMRQLGQAFTVKQIVIDASVPQWKAKLWQRDCDSLKLKCHRVTEKGAFVMSL